MEVSGKRAQEQSKTVSFTTASAEDFEFYCEPCDSEGTRVDAHGYCKNCEEFLCTTCFASHRRVRLTKNHILLDEEKMPKVQKPRKREKECTVPCAQHPQEIIIYYCKAHDEVGCHECMSSNHSDCVNDYIPDIADGTKDSPEYKTMLQELDDVEREAKQKKIKANESKKSVDKCYTAAITNMQTFRQNMNVHLEKMERVLSEEAHKVKENVNNTMDVNLNDCDFVESSVERMKQDMNKADVTASQIFVQMKLSKTGLDKCKNTLQNCETVRSSHAFKFEANADIDNILTRQENFGKLVFEKQSEDMPSYTGLNKVVARPCGKVNVKSSTDIRDCDIFCLDLLSPQELVLADFNNKSVKIVCMKNGKVTHEMKLSIQPWSLAVLNKAKIAVITGWDMCFVRVSDALHLEKDISLRSYCSGIKCIQNKLLMLYDRPVPKLDLLNFQGETLQTILSDAEKRTLKDPRHVAVSANREYIYVSDCQGKNKITRFSMTGDVINVFKNENKEDDIKQPRGIAVAEDGSVFVCDFFGSSIRMFSADLSKQKTILTEADGINRPRSIYLFNTENKLFVSNCECNDILIFSLKWKIYKKTDIGGSIRFSSTIA